MARLFGFTTIALSAALSVVSFALSYRLWLVERVEVGLRWLDRTIALFAAPSAHVARRSELVRYVRDRARVPLLGMRRNGPWSFRVPLAA